MGELARAAAVLGSAPEVALACHLDPDADALDPGSLGHAPSVPAPERSHVMHPDDAT